MGDAPLPTEHVLVIFYPNMPEEVKEVIQQKFSHAETTIYESQGSPVPSGKWLSFLKIEVTETKARAEVYQKATILATFSDLPDLKDSKKYNITSYLNHFYSALTINIVLN